MSPLTRYSSLVHGVVVWSIATTSEGRRTTEEISAIDVISPGRSRHSYYHEGSNSSAVLHLAQNNTLTLNSDHSSWINLEGGVMVRQRSKSIDGAFPARAN